MKALLIVDMCKGFVDKETKDGPCALYMPGAWSLVPRINTLMSYMDKDEWIVIHANDSHSEEDPEFERFPPHCLYSSEEHDTADGFDYQRLHVDEISKYAFSAFHDTALLSLLVENDVKELMIVGVATDACIFFTAADAVDNGYEVTIPLDCVEPIDVARGKGCLIMLRDMFGVNLTRTENAVRKV